MIRTQCYSLQYFCDPVHVAVSRTQVTSQCSIEGISCLIPSTPFQQLQYVTRTHAPLISLSFTVPMQT